MTQEIRFYRVQDPYGEFSNFAPFPLTIAERRWPTSEHYFQAMKFLAEEHQEAIRAVASPSVAARMGRSRQRPLRADWEAVKLDITRTAVLAKFTQHAKLQKLLLSTADATLIEHTPRDAYWGDGGNGQGENWLGKILMEVRSELASSTLPTQPAPSSGGKAPTLAASATIPKRSPRKK